MTIKPPLQSLWARALRFCCVALALTLLAACTGVPQVISNRAFHGIDFQPGKDTDGIEALFYRYGSANEFGLRTTSDQAALGKPIGGVGMTGNLPVGNDFYVKWRDTTTGQIHEDTVDLKSRLPFRMDRQTLKPIIEGKQLYIYLISFDEVRPFFTYLEVREIEALAKTMRQRTISQFARRKVIQIYPTRMEDPHLPASFKK